MLIDKSLDDISSLIYNKIPPPFPYLSKWKRKLEPSNKNWPGRKLSSSFVSDIISISMFPFTWWTRRSNLFLIELILKCAMTILFKFLMRRGIRSILIIWCLYHFQISHSKLTSWRNTYISICSFVQLFLIKFAKFLQRFHNHYGWSEVFFYSNGFSCWYYYVLEKSFFLCPIFWKVPSWFLLLWC